MATRAGGTWPESQICPVLDVLLGQVVTAELLLPYLSVQTVQAEATWVSHTTGAQSVTTGKKKVLRLGKPQLLLVGVMLAQACD